MSEVLLPGLGDSDILARLDFATPEVDEVFVVPDETMFRTAPLSPIITRAIGSVVEQTFTRPDGSGDRNLPQVNAFNSVK